MVLKNSIKELKVTKTCKKELPDGVIEIIGK